MIKISTSILSVEEKEIINVRDQLEKAKTDYFHIDVMDGKFVENNTNKKMEKFCDKLKNNIIPLDVHLMVDDVKKYIDIYKAFNPQIITFHIESCLNQNEVFELINYIKMHNIKVGLSIKPNTNTKEIYDFLPFIDLVLIMTVEPGKGGQELIPETITKIDNINKYIEKNNIKCIIEADGGINIKNCKNVINAGTQIIVSGSEIIKSNNYEEIINKLKQC